MAYPSFLRVLEKTDLERSSEACRQGFHSNVDTKGDFPLMIGNYKLKTFLSKNTVTGMAESVRLCILVEKD